MEKKANVIIVITVLLFRELKQTDFVGTSVFIILGCFFDVCLMQEQKKHTHTQRFRVL